MNTTQAGRQAARTMRLAATALALSALLAQGVNAQQTAPCATGQVIQQGAEGAATTEINKIKTREDAQAKLQKSLTDCMQRLKDIFKQSSIPDASSGVKKSLLDKLLAQACQIAVSQVSTVVTQAQQEISQAQQDAIKTIPGGQATVGVVSGAVKAVTADTPVSTSPAAAQPSALDKLTCRFTNTCK